MEEVSTAIHGKTDGCMVFAIVVSISFYQIWTNFGYLNSLKSSETPLFIDNPSEQILVIYSRN